MPKKRTRLADLIKEVGDERIKKMALERAHTQGMTLEMLSKKYEIKVAHVRKLLAYAVEHPTLLSDNEAHLIADRSSLNQFPHTKQAETYTTKNYYAVLLSKRAQNQRALRETEERKILDKISELEVLLANYNDIYSSDEELEHPREEIEEELENLKKIFKKKG